MRLRLPLARLASVLLFAALCAVCAYWALQLLTPRPPIAPSGAVAQAQVPFDVRQAGQLFGAPARSVAGPAAAAAPANVQVLGVLAAGPRGVALLAIDGKPAKPFQVGDTVADGITLTSVSADAVGLLRNGQASQAPAPARPSLDVLTRGPRAGATNGTPPGGATPSAGLPGLSPPGLAPMAGAVPGSNPGAVAPIPPPPPEPPPGMGQGQAPMVPPPTPGPNFPTQGVPGAPNQ